MSEGIPLPPPEAAAPKRIGKYRILRQIAQGGMAEIYLASASGIEGFEKVCVLKRILPLLATNREFVQMFLDEARIAASLLHSNIAQVFDIGSEAGSYYFVMEFLRGQDIRHILQSSVAKQSFVPYEHIVSMITGVCSGLHYAHEMRGKDGKRLHLVHRDISPQNVFVTHDGNVKLCDFGIAKSAAQLTETRVGTLKGKIRYMSPEQCGSEPLDRRSDVFALSIVLWELITLRRLFSGKSDFEIFKAIVEEPMPLPSEFRPDVPAGLEQIVMKGLSRERESRYQTAQELQLALEDWARQDRVPASSVRLASFMTDLFGPPPPVESFLGRATESDPLAQRIRSLNDAAMSESEMLDQQRLSARQGSQTVPLRTIAGTPDDTASAAPAPAGLEPESEPSVVAAELEPSMNLSRPAPKLLVFAACAACAAAIAALVMRPSPRIDVPVPATVSTAAGRPAPALAPAEAPAHMPPAADGLRVPATPPVEPQRTVEELPEPPPTRLTPPRPSQPPRVVHTPPRKKAKKSDPAAKKTGALDELLPP